MNGLWIFLTLVFIAVFLLSHGLAVPVFGEGRKMRRRLLARLGTLAASVDGERASLLRAKYLKQLTPLERRLESLPGMARLARLIEQSGRTTAAYRVVLLSLLLAAGAGVGAWLIAGSGFMTAAAALVGLVLPVLNIVRTRAARVAKFEEQLPEALDVIKRALRAGHPFVQSLKLVAEDMEAPISREFECVFADIKYGSDLRVAMLGLLERMPSVSVVAFITAVLIQKETGGNLAETLERITSVIRGRFKLQRRVRTLSAEGRLSAWILALVPLVLFVVIWFTTPDYLPTLVKHPLGPRLIASATVLGILGILWIRSIIRIRV